MAPSGVDVTQKLTCCVCEESLETVSCLHYHQMCYHTTEELSLALLTLKGLKLLVGDLEEATDSEDAVLRTGLAKYPHFLLIENSNNAESDSESTATAESSKLQGAISTLNGESVTVPLVRMVPRTDANGEEPSSSVSTEELSEDINVTPLRSKNVCKTRMTLRKRRNDTSMCKDTAVSKRTCSQNSKRKHSVVPNRKNPEKCEDQNTGNPCCSDDGKTVGGKSKNNSETDTDNEVPKRCVPKFPHCSKSNDNHTEDNSCDTFSTVFIKSDVAASEVESDKTRKGRVDSDCPAETHGVLTSSPKTGTNGPIHKVSSSSSPSSVDSFPSPDNSPRPSRYIKAIISRLPNIIIPDTDQNSNVKSQGRRTSRKKQGTPRKYVNDSYVLPSPVSRHHRSSVLYDYSTKQQSKENVQFQDFFAPKVRLEKGIDAECGTSPLDISEKEVQTTITNPSDDDSGIQVEEKERKCKKNPVDECTNKQTQTGLLSVTTQRLAAYRKQPLRKCQKEQCNSKKCDSSSDTNTVQKGEVVESVGVNGSKTCNLSSSSSSSSHHLKNSNPACCDALESKQAVGHGVEGKAKVLSKSLMKIYPRGMTDRRFFCEPCGKGYKKKSHLERHVRVHTGERPFQCSHCEKRFAVRSILKQHVRTHTGEKPYCCTVCQQRFPQKSGLMTHTMLHTGKPFKCDRCEKAFVSNHKLVQHLKSHGGPRKYVCPTCGTEFFTSGALLQHEQTHNRKGPHLCMICGNSFRQETQLKLHLDQHLQKFNSIDAPT